MSKVIRPLVKWKKLNPELYNIYLGLMTSEEREEFIEWVIQSYGKLFQGETFLSLIY